MKNFDSKWVKYIAGAVGGIIAGVILMFGGVKVVYPAISQLVGLSVAQSATLWNSVVDAAKGDALSSGILGQSTYLWNGLTFDRWQGTTTNGGEVDVTRISGSVTPADAYANPTTANQMWSLNGVFNGTTWDRQDSISNTNNTATTSQGTTYSTPLSTWSVTHLPAVTTKATISKASGGGTVRHVATGIVACLANPVAIVEGPRIVNLRDGATGAGTILMSWAISTFANDSKCVTMSGLNMTGTAATAMTIEFDAAGGAGTQETVTLTGYSTP